MSPLDWILLAGSLGTLVIIWQNWLSFRDTRTDLENRLRERTKGRGAKKGNMGVTVDEIRIYELSWPAKIKWYLGLGIDSGVEVKIESNLELDEEVWEKVEEGFKEIETASPEIEFLNNTQISGGKTAFSIIRIDSTDESEIMAAVCAIPILVSNMDLSYDVQQPPSMNPAKIPEELEEELRDKNG